ncbi:MAG TPA: GFA family protein [Caulobacteraceae bacterium]|nr:GFA family protein [Caulobacteraceae bacterium]
MQTGRCLCGAVTYEIAGALAGVQLCHCSQCRRASGSAFAANMPVRAGNFRITAGERTLKAYESSPGKERVFCGACGSPIISRSVAAPGWVRVRAGTLDEPAATSAAFHFHTDSRAGWLPITDDLPRYPGERPE